VAINAFRRFVTFLAKMGLIVRDDSPRVIDMTGREWGEPADGLALSIREGKKDDPGQLPVLSVVMRNAGPERKALTIPGWLFFYSVWPRVDEAGTPDGENRAHAGAGRCDGDGPADRFALRNARARNLSGQGFVPLAGWGNPSFE
jgi:hypothetical protein